MRWEKIEARMGKSTLRSIQGRSAWLASLACVACLAGSVEGASLTWTDLLAEARARHQTLQKASLAVHASESGRRVAEGELYPSLSASSSWSNGLDGTPSSYGYGLSGRYQVFDGFRRDGQIDQAETALLQSRVAYEGASADIRLALRSAYVNVLYAQALIPLSEGILSRRKEVADVIGLQYEAGKEDKGAKLRGEALVAQAAFDVESAKRNLTTAMWELAIQLGRRSAVVEKVDGALEVPSPPGPEDFSALARTTVAYRAADAEVTKAKAAVKTAEAVWYPDVALTSGWNQSGSDLLKTTGRWSVGLSASYPIFNGGKHHAQTAQALIQLTQAVWSAERVETETASSLAKAHANVQDAVQELVIRVKLKEAAEIRSQIAKQQYANGIIGFRDWDLIESDTVQAERALLAGQRAAALAWMQWERALGKGVETP